MEQEEMKFVGRWESETDDQGHSPAGLDYASWLATRKHALAEGVSWLAKSGKRPAFMSQFDAWEWVSDEFQLGGTTSAILPNTLIQIMHGTGSIFPKYADRLPRDLKMHVRSCVRHYKSFSDAIQSAATAVVNELHLRPDC